MVKKLYFVSFPLKRKAESSQIDLFVDIFSMADFQDHHHNRSVPVGHVGRRHFDPLRQPFRVSGQMALEGDGGGLPRATRRPSSLALAFRVGREMFNDYLGIVLKDGMDGKGRALAT